MSDPKSPLDARRDQLAENADKMDYSHCSDSGIVIGFRKGWNAAVRELTELAKAPKDDILTKSENANILKEHVNETDNVQHNLAPKDAREFWIYDIADCEHPLLVKNKLPTEPCDFPNVYKNKMKFFDIVFNMWKTYREEIHVIEHSAYLAVKQELEATRADWQKQTQLSVSYAMQLDKAKEQIARLSQVLHKIAEAERMGYGTQRTYGEMAQKALDEISKNHSG